MFCIPEFMVEVLIKKPRPLCCVLFVFRDVKNNQDNFRNPSFLNTMNGDLSRANSRASARSRNGSTLSRNQSLIKKNIQLQDLKPADVLIERFVAWKAIVQQLTAYFEVNIFHLYCRIFIKTQFHTKGIADIETNTAKELTKLAGVIQVPFRAGNQFLGEGGLQVILSHHHQNRCSFKDILGRVLRYQRQDSDHRRSTC